MAKVQGKKIAASARRARGKVAVRVKKTARVIKKKVAKPAARIKSKKVARAAKPATAKHIKAVKKAAAALPSKPTAVRPMAAKGPVAPRVPVVPAAPAKKVRARRPRPRIQSNGAPVAAWLPPGAEKPRPSSFIPAPPRAEAPSLIAAPPASSDRLIRPEDVTEFVTRTVPVRVDVEQSGGRVYISVNPEEVVLRAGEGIEWDFRYIGGADVTIDELLIDFDKPSPFSQTNFRSRKPGAARPHRQLSGAVHASSAGKTIRYAIKAMTPFKTELAVARPVVTIQL
jgi:hypothetical protein